MLWWRGEWSRAATSRGTGREREKVLCFREPMSLKSTLVLVEFEDVVKQSALQFCFDGSHSTTSISSIPHLKPLSLTPNLSPSSFSPSTPTSSSHVHRSGRLRSTKTSLLPSNRCLPGLLLSDFPCFLWKCEGEMVPRSSPPLSWSTMLDSRNSSGFKGRSSC